MNLGHNSARFSEKKIGFYLKLLPQNRLDLVFSLFRSFLQDLWGPCTLLKRFMKSLLMNLGHNSARFSEKKRFLLEIVIPK